MDTKKNKKQLLIKLIVCLIFGLLIYLKHQYMDIISDDSVIIPTLEGFSLVQRFGVFWTKYYSNGRVFTDTLAAIIYYFPFNQWKIIDSIIYVILMLLTVDIFTEKSVYSYIYSSCMFLMFPFGYLSSAGYIATSTNYIYTILGVLFAVRVLKKAVLNEKINLVTYLLAAIGIIYSCNHDQTAIAMIVGFLSVLIYVLVDKKHRISRKGIIIVSSELVLTIATYIWMWNLPGHIARMNSTSEMEIWLPQFADWSFTYKILKGFSSTVVVMFFTNLALMILLYIFLFFLSSKSSKKMKCIGMIPLFLTFIITIIGGDKFFMVYEYSCGLPDIGRIGEGKIFIWTYVICFTFIITIISSVILFVKNKNRKNLILLMIAIAAITREIMGFSPTIYASSYRTFALFAYLLIPIDLLLVSEIMEQADNKYRKHLSLAMTALMFAMYI